jgi:hypothetical protein
LTASADGISTAANLNLGAIDDDKQNKKEQVIKRRPSATQAFSWEAKYFSK